MTGAGRGSQADLEVLTTFEAARICNANVNSIKNWIAQGKLQAYRTPGGHYRIEKRHLRKFLREHSMPDPFGALQKRILVVDDEPNTLEALRLALSGTYELTTVSDGYEALVLIGQEQPDLVVLDILMPGLNGLEVIQRLAEMESLPATRILAYSGSLDAEIEHRALAAGASAFWRKSGSLEDLESLIAELLNESGPGG